MKSKAVLPSVFTVEGINVVWTTLKNVKQRRHTKGQTKSLLIVAKSKENRISIV